MSLIKYNECNVSTSNRAPAGVKRGRLIGVWKSIVPILIAIIIVVAIGIADAVAAGPGSKGVSIDFTKIELLKGGRNLPRIRSIVAQNSPSLAHAFNRRLREKPDMSGRITVKFSINEHGNVILAQITESTINDSELEDTVLKRVQAWDFFEVDMPGDVTEVVFPFIFLKGLEFGKTEELHDSNKN
jgi:TonB family protein